MKPKKTARGYTVNGVYFSQLDYEKIMAALRLRAESCDDNQERQKAAGWRKTAKKVIQAFIPFKE